MSQSLSRVYVHITFSTKDHQPYIDDTIEISLFEYIGGICKGLDCNPVKIGGHHDHVHILCLLSRKTAQMKLLEEIKKQSSKCPPAGQGRDQDKRQNLFRLLLAGCLPAGQAGIWYLFRKPFRNRCCSCLYRQSAGTS